MKRHYRFLDCADDETEKLLNQEHLEEIVGGNGAKVLAWGFFSGPRRVESKTTKGLCISTINPKTKKVSHRWLHEWSRQSLGYRWLTEKRGPTTR